MVSSESISSIVPGMLVLAEIEDIQQFGASCKLIEYNVDAFLPIREVSSGWIKNIHEFIHKGQIVVAKVMLINKDKGSIDISLKKVTNQESRIKMNAYNLEKRSQALFMQALKASRLSQFKDKYTQQILSSFGSFSNFINEVNANSEKFDSLQLPKKLKDTVSELLMAGKREKMHVVSYILTLQSFNTKSGILEIKDALRNAISKAGINVEYISAPHYRITAQALDYPTAEAKIKAAVTYLNSCIKDGTVSIEKEKLKKEKEDILHSIYKE
ncbi:MAG: S1 RNA-binding domain-containing protein [Candidatus Micrarchaeaceae archaeon]